MGSQRPPCPHCGGFLIRDFDILQNGDIVPCVRCLNCGFRLIPPPKCTTPSHSLIHYFKEKDPQYMVGGKHSPNTRIGVCSNCHREIPLVSKHLCRFCFNRQDGLEEATMIVKAWIAAGKPGTLGTFARWRWKPTEEIGREMRSLRCG